MDAIASSNALLQPTSNSVGAANGFADLGGEDFFGLLIAQLMNQDPLEPTGNEELLQQISSIREIELSSTLTESLRSLTGQQHFASGSALIGRYVAGGSAADGTAISGVVVGVRFGGDGEATLQLANGTELPLSQVSRIESQEQAGAALVGLVVMGVDRRNAAEPRVVEGAVTAVRTGDTGEVLLELDTGDDVRLVDVLSTTSAA